MNFEAYFMYTIILLITAIITLFIISYANVKNDFSKKITKIIIIAFIIDALILGMLVVKTWF